jgi:hypothetical protein
MGLVMEGAVQHAPQPGRHGMDALSPRQSAILAAF